MLDQDSDRKSLFEGVSLCRGSSLLVRRFDPLTESAKLCLEEKHTGNRPIASFQLFRMSRTVVHQQQRFRRTNNVWCTLVAFNNWDEIFLEPLSKNLRVHPNVSLRLVNARERNHVYV